MTMPITSKTLGPSRHHERFQTGYRLSIRCGTGQTNHRKPDPLEYPMSNIPVRHYGKMMFEIFDKLKTMEPGDERDELVRVTANQMKRNLALWSHGSSDDEKVASDLARYTDGKIQPI